VAGKTAYIVAALLAIPMGFTLLLVVLLGGATQSSLAAVCEPSGAETTVVTGDGLDSSQMAIAQEVVAAVRAFPATSSKPHAAVIALATARQESDLRNLTSGDRDSLGVFQQRPSQGWGTPAQIMNVAHATTTFLQHLVRLPAWESRSVTDVAADVQQPAEAYRGLYEQWVPLATRLTGELWSAAAVPSSTLPECPAAPIDATDPIEETTTVRAQSWVDASVPYSQELYFTNEYGTYRQDCSGYVSMAWGLSASLTTYSLPTVAHQISKDQLRPGDIMLRPGHTLLFDGWANPEHTSYWAYEEQHPGTVAVHHVVPYPYWSGQGVFRPFRKN
jgi:hypothetical protein